LNNKYGFTIDEIDEKKRLDHFLSHKIIGRSRSWLKKCIEDGFVRVNGKSLKPNYRLKSGDVIEVNLPQREKPPLKPENIPLDILFEDEDLLVINKPRGMVVYPAPGNFSGTLVNALLFHTERLSEIGGRGRPGIVHRLDKDTSGVMVVAKNDFSHVNLSKQLKSKQMKKIYKTIVWGIIQEKQAVIDAPIGRHPVKRTEMAVGVENAKEAITHFKVLERFSEFTYLEVKLETGRTHQIRVHMKFIGHPVVGDPVYTRKKNPFKIKGQALHAYSLGLYHPRSGEYMEFVAPLPKDFSSIIKLLREREGI
jgi:23S rRNA pseudouridine1911/1915/1917 synthase